MNKTKLFWLMIFGAIALPVMVSVNLSLSLRDMEMAAEDLYTFSVELVPVDAESGEIILAAKHFWFGHPKPIPPTREWKARDRFRKVTSSFSGFRSAPALASGSAAGPIHIHLEVDDIYQIGQLVITGPTTGKIQVPLYKGVRDEKGNVTYPDRRLLPTD